MLAYVEGEVRAALRGSIVVSANGIGYKIAVTKETVAMLPPGAAARLWTHLAVRENALDLYGFRAQSELVFFELLLTVSGIGPKSALAILDIASVETLRSAIARGNAGYLTTVSGIGKKTAEKIVLELKDKVGVAAEGPGAHGSDEDALEALAALGYSGSEAREALRRVPDTFVTSNDRLREALKLMGGKK